jgi:RHS repeat-associated protein
VLTTYLYDDSGFLVGIDQGGARYLVATDQIGTPRMVVAMNGTVVRRFNDTAYGLPIADSDPSAAESDPSFSLPIGFAGGIQDPTTGLVRFGLRDYDPASGSWMARDPSLFDGSPTNLYKYAGGDPVNYSDPTGLWCVGFSGYFGLGGGGTVCVSNGQVSTCTEVGVGIGGGLTIDFTGSVHAPGTFDVTDVSVGYGLGPKVRGFELGVGAEYSSEQQFATATGAPTSSCPSRTLTVGASFGPVSLQGGNLLDDGLPTLNEQVGQGTPGRLGFAAKRVALDCQVTAR